MDIGARIKQLRLKNNLTQEELASRCELTKGFLSQLENNIAEPSLATLSDIVEALGTNMSSFFAQEKIDKIVFSEDDYFVDEKDGYTINWIVPNAQKNDMEPILVEIKPLSSSQIMSEHEGQEFGYVLEGRITLVNGEKEFKLRKGNTFYINGNHSHYLKNESNNKAVVLWVSNPPLF